MVFPFILAQAYTLLISRGRTIIYCVGYSALIYGGGDVCVCERVYVSDGAVPLFLLVSIQFNVKYYLFVYGHVSNL